MELSKNKKDVSLKEYIERITTPIFAKTLNIPCEELANSMTTSRPTIKKIWRPNNYRREIKILKHSNSTLLEIGGTIGLFPVEKYINPHTKILSIKDYKPGITIQLFKTTLVAIYKQPIINGVKQEYLIEAYTTNEIVKIIEDKKREIQELLDSTLLSFAKRVNLYDRFAKPIWSRYEDYHRQDSFIDKLPEDLIIHAEHFKKVYGKGVEFINSKLKDEPGLKIENYITNQALIDKLPNFEAKLDNILTRTIAVLDERNKIDKEFMVHIKTHTAVMKKINKALSQRRIYEY